VPDGIVHFRTITSGQTSGKGLQARKAAREFLAACFVLFIFPAPSKELKTVSPYAVSLPAAGLPNSAFTRVSFFINLTVLSTGRAAALLIYLWGE
jgi:hypothetical protein